MRNLSQWGLECRVQRGGTGRPCSIHGEVILACATPGANSVSDAVSTHSDTTAGRVLRGKLIFPVHAIYLKSLTLACRSCRPLFSTFTDNFWMGVLPWQHHDWSDRLLRWQQSYSDITDNKLTVDIWVQKLPKKEKRPWSKELLLSCLSLKVTKNYSSSLKTNNCIKKFNKRLILSSKAVTYVMFWYNHLWLPKHQFYLRHLSFISSDLFTSILEELV